MRGWRKIGEVARAITERVEPRVVAVYRPALAVPVVIPVTVIEHRQEPIVLKIKVERGT